MPATRDSIANVKRGVINVLKSCDLAGIHDHDPGELPEISEGAVVTLTPPRLDRTDLEEKDSELGSRDWRLYWTMRIYRGVYDDARQAQAEIEADLSQITGAFDGDYTLQNTAGVKDAKVLTGESGFQDTGNKEPPKQLVLYTCQLGVFFTLRD